MIRTLIAEDEPVARERLRTLLTQEEDVQVIGDCKDGEETINAVRALKPDLLFLDVEMPNVNGFGVLDEVGPDACPVVIFTTAYDHYAVKAFDMHALDYLLKPFDETRLKQALNRARTHIQRSENEQLAHRLFSLLQDVGPKFADRLVIRSGGRIVFLKTREIDWIEAAGNYVQIHSGEHCHLVRETMNSMESKLDTSMFLRIHRSIIVNVESIKELEPCGNGEYIVQLYNGKGLSLSRSFRDRLDQLLGSDTPASKRIRAI